LSAHLLAGNSVSSIQSSSNSRFFQLLANGSAEWGVPPPLDERLLSSEPQQGLEIRRIPRRPYLPLRGLIAGPTIIVRKLDTGDQSVKLWISKNWNRIAAVVNCYQQSFPPHPEYRETCLALTEYISESWTTIYDEGNPDSINLFPIVLGYAEGNDARPSWSGLQLPRPTMSARLGTGEWNVYQKSPKLINSKSMSLGVTD
jgi:hypothetical protein